MGSDESWKQKKPKFRQVDSRFLSPISSPEYGFQSPNNNNDAFSPIRQKAPSLTDTRKHKSLEKSGFLRGLWPSSTPSPPSKSKLDTLADYLGNDRLKGLKQLKNHEKKSDDSPVLISKQRSCSEFSRFENNDQRKISKGNHKQGFGEYLRYTGRLRFPGTHSSSSSSKNSEKSLEDPSDCIAPGRFSVDETALIRRKNFSDSDSEYSDVSGASLDINGQNFPAPYMASTVSSRKHGISVPSRYMNDSSLSQSRRWIANSGTRKPVPSSDNSPKRLTSRNSMKKNSPTSLSSPGENRGKIMGLWNSKPPTSPSRANNKGVGGLLSIGIELLKGKKSSPRPTTSSEVVHQLRLLNNRLIQWRYSNARAEAVNQKIAKRAKSNVLYAWDGLMKLQQSVLHKKLQIQKEKLEMKLNYIIQSQIKSLETWENMERDHILAISTTKDYMHSVVCGIPLVEGAKVELQSASIAIRHASDVSASINMMLTKSTSAVEKTGWVLVELARVVTQEKLLLQQCLELLDAISSLQVKEMSLKSVIMQTKSFHQQYHYHPEYLVST